jgi:hypothetical protein
MAIPCDEKGRAHSKNGYAQPMLRCTHLLADPISFARIPRLGTLSNEEIDGVRGIAVERVDIIAVRYRVCEMARIYLPLANIIRAISVDAHQWRADRGF